jgi:hypothetical protein
MLFLRFCETLSEPVSSLVNGHINGHINSHISGHINGRRVFWKSSCLECPLVST